MKLYLQFGYGMMAHTTALIEEWKGGRVILSPRDLSEAQLLKVAKDVHKIKGTVLIDPQCFLHDADHINLCKHDYFKAFRAQTSSSFANASGVKPILKELATLSKTAAVDAVILPGLLAKKADRAWFDFHESVVSEAPQHFKDVPLYATVAISADVTRDEVQIEEIIERARKWKVAGFYIVAETPTSYLVDDPIWLSNLMILAAGFKLADKAVVVGYSNHQTLCLACANVDGIGSGTWMNVRAFPIEKFYQADDEEQRRKATWFYCPHALSEYKLQFLDVAKKQAILSEMKPDASLKCRYTAPLFAGAQPSAVEWGEQNAFRHYLTCLRSQIRQASKSSYEDTKNHHLSLLQSAETSLKRFRAKGVFGQDREFTPYLDVNRAALSLFDAARGEQLQRNWS